MKGPWLAAEPRPLESFTLASLLGLDRDLRHLFNIITLPWYQDACVQMLPPPLAAHVILSKYWHFLSLGLLV